MIKPLIRTICLLLALPFSHAGVAGPAGPADVTGVLTAVKSTSRDITVGKAEYRVRLSARIDMPDEGRIPLEKLRPGALVKLYLEEENGDVRDLVVVVYP